MAANDRKEALNVLYDKLVDVFMEVLDKEPTASDLNAIRQFLKDNNIDVMSKPGSKVDNLRQKVLPFPVHTGEDEKAL
jgi:hypothetical protein